MNDPRTAAAALDVALPERVALKLPIAGLGSRCLAYLVDLCLFVVLWMLIMGVIILLERTTSFADLVDSRGLLIAALGTAFVLQYVYWTLIEWLTVGQSVGKRVVGLRVVQLDGAPVGFLQSAVRNLCRTADFLPAGYAFATLLCLARGQSRRLGDVAAGTLVIRDERVSLDKYEGLVGDAGSSLPPATLEWVLSFLERYPQFDDVSYARLAEGIVSRIAPELGPDDHRRLGASRDALRDFLVGRLRGAAALAGETETAAT